jgi:RNA polymerase sigma-70 factor (ECF subfamily)
MDLSPADGPNRYSDRPLESTSILLDRVRSGDNAARERLFARVLPALRRWAHCRLPDAARGLHDTEDLVQVTVLRAFHRVDRFESRGQGAFLGYLRHILLNAIRDEIRRAVRRSPHGDLDEHLVDPGPTALDRAVGRQTMERYEQALATLTPDQQEAVIMRVELDFTYEEIAGALSLASAEAARKMIGRAIVRLAERMREHA